MAYIAMKIGIMLKKPKNNRNVCMDGRISNGIKRKTDGDVRI